jgi:hypothetical protein
VKLKAYTTQQLVYKALKYFFQKSCLDHQKFNFVKI